MTQIEPSLSTFDVHKSFGGIHAVRGLTLELLPGRVTGLIGPNGAGKTTAFNLITGFLRPDRGRVVFKGVDITGWPPYKVSGLGVNRTWQEVRPFPRMTVLENAMLARPHQLGEQLGRAILAPWRVSRQEKENERYCLDILESVGLGRKAELLAEDLSFAEQKLLSIARLLACDAECLLLDEPMSGLDEKTLVFTIRLIRRLATEGRTICLVEHNIDSIRDACDHALFLDLGRVLAEGTPAEIIANRELADLYFGT